MLRDATTKEPVSQLATDRAGHVYQTGGTSDYGTYPQNAYLDVNAALVASASADLYVSNDISIYDAFAFELITFTGTSAVVKAFPSFNGSVYAPNALAITDMSTNAVIAGNTGITIAAYAAFGIFMITLPTKCRKIKLTYAVTGTGDCSIRGGIWKR